MEKAPEERACVILGVIFLLSSICIVIKAIHDLAKRVLPEVLLPPTPGPCVCGRDETEGLLVIPVCPDDLAAAGELEEHVQLGMGSRVGAEPGRCWGGRSPITWTEAGSLLGSRRQMDDFLYSVSVLSGILCTVLAVIKFMLGKVLTSRALITDGFNSLVGGIMGFSILLSAEVFKHNSSVWYLDGSIGVLIGLTISAYGIKLLIDMVPRVRQTRHYEMFE
ncbi:Transmembrane protein [Turdus rufiventris]|nr:Transmembrane protein [Turdus rufiventris]